MRTDNKGDGAWRWHTFLTAENKKKKKSERNEREMETNQRKINETQGYRLSNTAWETEPILVHSDHSQSKPKKLNVRETETATAQENARI